MPDGIESGTYLGGTTDILELKESGSCIGFVNVQAVSLNQTDCACSTELTEVS